MEGCEFLKSTRASVYHEIGAKGIWTDPRKVCAIKKMATRTGVSELCCFLSMANQGKFFDVLSYFKEQNASIICLQDTN